MTAFRALVYDLRDDCEGLHVVDDSGLLVQTPDRHGRRFQSRLTALALKRVHDGRALAADIGARSGDYPDAHIPGEALFLGRFDRLAQQFDGPLIFAAHIDKAFLCPDGVSTDQNALDHGMGVSLHDDAVLIGAGFALVGVADQVFRLFLARVGAAPLFAGGEGRAAAPAQAGGLLDGRYQLAPIQGAGFFQRFIAAGSEIILNGIGTDLPHIPQSNAYFFHQCSPPSRAGMLPASTS